MIELDNPTPIRNCNIGLDRHNFSACRRTQEYCILRKQADIFHKKNRAQSSREAGSHFLFSLNQLKLVKKYPVKVTESLFAGY